MTLEGARVPSPAGSSTASTAGACRAVGEGTHEQAAAAAVAAFLAASEGGANAGPEALELAAGGLNALFPGGIASMTAEEQRELLTMLGGAGDGGPLLLRQQSEAILVSS